MFSLTISVVRFESRSSRFLMSKLIPVVLGCHLIDRFHAGGSTAATETEKDL